MTIAQMHYAGRVTHNDIKPRNWVLKPLAGSHDTSVTKPTGSRFEFTLVGFGSASFNDVRARRAGPTHIQLKANLSDVSM